MPVIGIPVDMLLERIQSRLDRDVLVEHLQHLGCDVEGYATVRRFRCRRCDNILEITETENPPVACDRCGADFKEDEGLRQELGESDVIRMELLAVRPDMFDPGGLARVLRNYLGEREDPARYQLAEPTMTVRVDPRLAELTSFRPHIACAVVRDISLDEDRIKVIMKLQENLHWALGRDRKRASIGVYDLDQLAGKTYQYRTVGPEELRFAPLGVPDEPMSPREILERHPKGAAYARLLAGFDRYPLLVDEFGTVLSMPPIINSESTRVTQQTRSFFVDVTGTEERIVNKTLNILITSLAELDPAARIERVRIAYADSQASTPDLTPQEVLLDPERAARTIGVRLDRGQVVGHLKAMGHGVRTNGSGPVTVLVPAYRNDIMHEIDLIEDVAIAYGYHNIEPSLIPTFTVGEELEGERQAGVVRRSMTGLGYFEVLTLILSSEEEQYDRMGLPRRTDFVSLAHPISVEQTLVRTSLLPGLLDTFAANLDHELPQRIFEVGNASFIAEVETGAREDRRVAGGAIGPRVDYAEIRAACEALLRELGWSLETPPLEPALGCFLPGRGARAAAVRGSERREVGVLGEIHPAVLERFRLSHPVSVFEVDLEPLR